MSLLLDGAIKGTLVLLVALGTVELLHRRSAAVRHWVLAVAIGCATVAPILGLALPSWQIPLEMFLAAPPDQSMPVVSTIVTTVLREPADAAIEGAGNAPAPAASGQRGSEWATWLPLVWGIGTAGSFLVLLVGLARLARLGSSARRVEGGRLIELTDEIGGSIGLRRRVVLLQSDTSRMLGTWGLVRPRVLLPVGAQDWPDDRARIVLSHELAHIRRGDWAMQMTAELLRAVYWFNPITWIACRRLRQESEHACDDAVLRAGVTGADYASHLLDLARTLNAERRAWLPAPAMARPSSLTGRITAMLNTSINHSPLTRAVRVTTAVALFVFTLSIAGFGGQSFFTFSGSVVDSTNRLIPGTTLIVTNAGSGAKHEVKSDSGGRFEFVGLPPGEYALEARRPGFAIFRDTFAVIGRNLDRAIELRVGDLEEAITVTASSGPATAEQDQRQVRQIRQGLANLQRVMESRRATQEKCDGASIGVVGGKIVPPRKLVSVNPEYPESLRIAKVGGVVTMEALIGLDGNVQDVRTIESPHPDLERAAVEAVRQWQFTQTLLNCTPVEVRMQVTTNFRVQP